MPQLREQLGTVKLVVPAGSFVLLHYNMWHGATPERAGRRRIMIKIHFDRIAEPGDGCLSSNDHSQYTLPAIDYFALGAACLAVDASQAVWTI